jgi:hypothetical protein
MDIIYQLFVIILGFLSIYFFKGQLRKSDIKTLRWLWVYHLFFGYIFGIFFTGDAGYYWEKASELNYDSFIENLVSKFGTSFIISFNYFPASALKMSYLSGTIAHTYFGFIGICMLYCIILQLVPRNSYFGKIKIFPLIMFLPNLHFWTVSIGKDSTSFLFIIMFFYSLLNFKKRFLLGILGVFLLYLIRPHVTLFALISFGIAYFFSSKATKYQRIILTILVLGMAIMILPKLLEYSKIDSLSTDNLDKFANERAGLLNRESTGSRLDVSSYPFVIKVFTFLYRPLFFDINNVTAILASVENLFLLLLTFKALKNKPFQAYKSAPLIIQSLIIFLIIGTLAFSQILSNMGIMLRMRNMFLPSLFLFILWANYYGSKSLKSK